MHHNGCPQDFPINFSRIDVKDGSALGLVTQFFIIEITWSVYSYTCPISLVPSFLLVLLDLVNKEGPSIEHNGYLCGRNPPMETLYLAPFPSLTYISWEEDTPPI